MIRNLPIAQIRLRYEAGETAQSIGQSLNVRYQVIQRRLQAMGVPLRGRGPTPAGAQRISQARQAKIDESRLRDLHGREMSTKEMADDLEVSAEAIRRRMKKLGLDRLQAKARPDRNFFWTGGLLTDGHGYILEHRPDHPRATKSGYVRQHRLVMENELGRFLTQREVVDHRNGDPSDNRPENLRLFASNGEHLRATRTGRAKLSRQERGRLTAEAVQRAKSRVAAIHEASGSGAGPSS